MTHALAAPMPRAAPSAAQAIRTFPYAAFTLVTAVVLACGAGIVNMPSSWARAADVPLVAADQPAEAVVAAPASTAGTSVVRGIVESIRALAPVADRPDEFEFTVRLRDRSARVSRSVGRAHWLVGDRIMLMGGGPPSN